MSATARNARAITPTTAIRRIRIALYRIRQLLTALVFLAAIWWTVEQLVPTPDQRAVVVVTGEIASGTKVRESDLTMRQIPTVALPENTVLDPSRVIGNPAIITLSPGTVVTDAMVASPNLGHSLTPDEVLVPVTFADRGSRSVAQAGQLIWLYSSGEQGVKRIASKARVLAVFPPETGNTLSPNMPEITDTLVAVPGAEARVLLEALSAGPIRAVLPAR